MTNTIAARILGQSRRAQAAQKTAKQAVVEAEQALREPRRAAQAAADAHAALQATDHAIQRERAALLQLIGANPTSENARRLAKITQKAEIMAAQLSVAASNRFHAQLALTALEQVLQRARERALAAEAAVDDADPSLIAGMTG